MTSTLAVPTTIRAAVGPKVIAKSRDLFDHRLPTIINELLQNARRAGATSVVITTEPIDYDRVAITIQDNGCGIADPQTLLTFGDSDWDIQTDYTEDAAGMGFFSLASHGATVRSHHWQVQLEPAAFIGKAEAVVTKCEPEQVGTAISFIATIPHTTNGAEKSALSTIAKAVRYYPISTVVNGALAQREWFLDGALHWQTTMGVKIGVFESSNLPGDEHGINFHGLLVKAGLPEIRVPFYKTYTARIDVIEAPDLKFVLPTRDKVINNEFYQQLCAAIKRTILQYCATQPHRLKFTDYDLARNLGIEFCEQPLLLKEWQAEGPDDSSYCNDAAAVRVNDTANAVLVDFNRDANAINIGNALPLNFTYNLYRAEDAFKGYSDYDSLRRLVKVEYTATVNGEAKPPIDAEDGFPDDIGPIVDSLRIGLHLESPSLSTTVFLNADVVAESDEGSWEAQYLISRENSPQLADVVSHMLEATFSPSDDYDADSYDTQRDEAEEHLRKEIAGYLLSGHTATIAMLASAVWDLRHEFTADIKSVTVTENETMYTFSDGTTETVKR